MPNATEYRYVYEHVERARPAPPSEDADQMLQCSAVFRVLAEIIALRVLLLVNIDRSMS